MLVKMPLLILLIFALGSFASCNRTHSYRVIVIQPLGHFPHSLAMQVYKGIKTINSKTILRPPIPITEAAYYAPRNRYRADTIIRRLSRDGNADTVIIGLTVKDISTSKNNIPDWGVMGLGYCPGNACIVSTFRLAKQQLNTQFYKVAIHELGHTQGLPHCSNKTCFMRDAEGGNPLNEEKDFCQSCKSFLKDKGWALQ